jgi:steroid delta-isomerase
MADVHPALAAAHASWAAVHGKQKQAWLDLMSDDIVIEDPIGVSPLDPVGKGQRGKAAVSAFWDKHMAESTIRIEAHESYAAGNESGHLMTLRTTLPNGVTTVVRGIFTYRIDDAGKLESLRGFWQLDQMQVEQPD